MKNRKSTIANRQSKRRLSKRQERVIDDLFESGLAEADVLTKHGVRPSLFRKWLADELFSTELASRIESARRQSQLIIARYAPLAAAKLVELASESSGETARKTCLDIISLPTAQAAKADDQPGQDAPEALSAETAGRLLAALAKEKTG